MSSPTSPGAWRRLLERLGCREAKPPSVLELRVHGVHNTPPQAMLGVTAGEIGQVAGDGLTGIFRTKDGKVPLRDLTESTAVEAYSWGALTSSVRGMFGWLRRFAWMFLLPFALMNLAYWARPELGFRTSGSAAHKRAATLSAGLLRVAALLLTMFLVLTPLTVGVDLIGWQCYNGGVVGCPTLPDGFDFLAGGHADPATRRLALGSLPALLLVVLLGILSRQSVARYEAVEDKYALTDTTGDHLVLRHPRLWSGKIRTRRLQRLHSSFALSVVIAYTGIPALFTDGNPGWMSWWDSSHRSYAALGVIVAAAALVAGYAVLQVARIQDDDIESTASQEADSAVPSERRGPLLLLCFSWSLVAADLAVLWWASFGDLDDTKHTLLGENVWFIAVFVLLTSLHVMTFLAGRARVASTVLAGIVVVVLAGISSTWLTNWALPSGWHHKLPLAGVGLVLLGVVLLAMWHYHYPVNHQGARATAWRGAGPSVLLAGAIWVGLLFTTSVVTLAANYLNGPDSSVGNLRTTVVNGEDDVSDARRTAAGKSLEAAGEVTIDGANILVTGGHVTVRSGSVAVDSLYWHRNNGRRLALSGENAHGAALRLPDELKGMVAYTDSCVYSSAKRGTHTARQDGTVVRLPDPCTGLTAKIRPRSGVLPAATGGQISLGSARHAVRVTSGNPPQAALTLPQVLVWAPLGQALWLLLAVGVAAWCWVRLRRKVKGPVRARVLLDGDVPVEDREVCTNVRVTAAFPHRGEQLLDWVGGVTVLVSIGIILGSLTGQAPWQLDGLSWTASLVTLALWVSLGMALGLVWLASQLRRSESARKAVGILWDLTTFWPRAAHPLAPPCYAERVVPELLIRIRWAVAGGTDGGGADLVILSGHSQGSTLLAAAASRLSDHDLDQVRMITYGSQLRAWYGRIFPAVFGPAALGYVPTNGTSTFGDPKWDAPDAAQVDDGPDTLAPDYTLALRRNIELYEGSLLERLTRAGSQPRWVNLFRRTDPIGFRVFSDKDHRGQDTYVLEVPTRAEGDPGPTVMTHGSYPQTVEYRTTIRAWTQEVLPAPSTPRIARPPFHPES